MVKLSPVPQTVAVEVAKYERYLPTAFSSHLSLLEKVDKLESTMIQLEQRIKELEGRE